MSSEGRDAPTGSVEELHQAISQRESSDLSRWKVSNMTFQFEKLLVYQKSIDFADDDCSATEKFTLG